MEDPREERYQRAKKRMEEIKGFYTHLVVYLIINVFIILAQIGVFNEGWYGLEFPGWAVFTTPFFWGIGLFFHGLYVFTNNFSFFKKWEERKIKEYMDKEDEGYKKTSRWE